MVHTARRREFLSYQNKFRIFQNLSRPGYFYREPRSATSVDIILLTDFTGQTGQYGNHDSRSLARIRLRVIIYYVYDSSVTVII